MPVRIIFRGLILFRIENENTADGRIIAQLIDHDMSAAGGGGGMSMSGTKKAARGMSAMDMSGTSEEVASVHRHQAEIQILTGEKGQSIVPMRLRPGIHLKLAPRSGEYISATPSYRSLVPNLGKVVEKIANSAHRPSKGERQPQFIRNAIVINRGAIRATEIVNWDNGGYPLDGSARTGNAARSPVDVLFMSSDYMGQVAGECIVDVDDATSIDLTTIAGADGADSETEVVNEVSETLAGPWTAASESRRHTQHVAPDTVEILVTNLPPQRAKPIPWSVHYQWLFRAAGYQSAPYDYVLLQRFREAAQRYAGDSFDVEAEDLALLDGEQRDRGLPFPYLRFPYPADIGRRNPLAEAVGTPLTDPWNRPLCPHGDE